LTAAKATVVIIIIELVYVGKHKPKKRRVTDKDSKADESEWGGKARKKIQMS
jgi:hypothetical protein